MTRYRGDRYYHEPTGSRHPHSASNADENWDVLAADQLGAAVTSTITPECLIRAHTGTDDCITTTDVRVRYAETDQMGVAHHAVYLVWCELGRTQHMRELGVTYRALEESGIRLPVVDARLRFRSAARYDDLLSIHSWIRECASRRVQFGNAIFRGEQLLATGLITLIATNDAQSPISIPREVRDRLLPTTDPVRL